MTPGIDLAALVFVAASSMRSTRATGYPTCVELADAQVVSGWWTFVLVEMEVEEAKD
jgi:hypothetical protein